MKILIPVLAAALLVSCTAKPAAPTKPTAPETAADSARPTLAQQKVCADQAKKAFDDDQLQARELGQKDALADYTSHFDPQKGICYVRIETTMATKGGSIVSTAVYDAFERRGFASYMWMNYDNKKFWQVKPAQCEVNPPNQEAIHCQSRDEFNSLVDKWFGVAE